MDYILLFNDGNIGYYYLFNDGNIYMIKSNINQKVVAKWSILGAIVGFLLHVFKSKICNIVTDDGVMIILIIIGIVLGIITAIILRINSKKEFLTENKMETSLEKVKDLILRGEEDYKKRKNLRNAMFIFSSIGSVILNSMSMSIVLVMSIVICWWISVLLLMLERPILYTKLIKAIKNGYLVRKEEN